MATERGSATDLDCGHDTTLGEVQVTGVGRAPRLTMAAEDIRHLELRPDHVGLASGRRRRLNVGEFEWALNFGSCRWLPAFGGGVAHVGLVNAAPASPMEFDHVHSTKGIP